MILLEMEDVWHTSEEYKFCPIDMPHNEYKIKRDCYKAQRIYELYGFEYFGRFVIHCPHIQNLMDDYVPCKREQNIQCTMFCHKYDVKKGCMLNAAK